MIKGLLISVYFSLMLFVMGNHLLNKYQKYSYKIFLLQLGYVFLFSITCQFSSSFSDFIEIFIAIIYFKLLFNENIIKSTYYVSIIYGIRYILEFIIFALDETVFYYYQILNFLSSHYVIRSYLIGGLTTFVVIMFKDKLNKILMETKYYPIKYALTVILVILIVTILMFARNYVIDLFPEVQLIIEISFLVFSIYIVCILLKQRKHIENITKQYIESTEYYKMTEGLLEEYRYILHENKNQLLIIKSMIEDNYELEEYLNHLINGRRNLKYEWVCDLKNIPIEGLKGLVNYKISEMKKKNLNVEIYIDDEIGKLKIKTLTEKDQYELYSIIGVFLDNALEASSLSQEKMVSIQCFKEDNKVHIMIANTYAGKVDLNKINELGYSSKGKNRGVGLPLVNKILEKHPFYKNETELFDIFFVQHLYVKLPNNT